MGELHQLVTVKSQIYIYFLSIMFPTICMFLSAKIYAISEKNNCHAVSSMYNTY